MRHISFDTTKSVAKQEELKHTTKSGNVIFSRKGKISTKWRLFAMGKKGWKKPSAVRDNGNWTLFNKKKIFICQWATKMLANLQWFAKVSNVFAKKMCLTFIQPITRFQNHCTWKPSIVENAVSQKMTRLVAMTAMVTLFSQLRLVEKNTPYRIFGTLFSKNAIFFYFFEYFFNFF